MKYITTIDEFIIPLKCIVAIQPSETGTFIIKLITGETKHARIADTHNTIARWIDIVNGTA